jgi:hypothetical protein
MESPRRYSVSPLPSWATRPDVAPAPPVHPGFDDLARPEICLHPVRVRAFASKATMEHT